MPEYYDDLQVDDIKFIAKKDQLSRDGVTAQIRLMDIDAFHVDETSMPVQDGEVKPELGNDILKLILANRDEARQMIKVFVKGYNLKDGALAISFTQKTPRIIAVGVSDDDIYEAIKTIDRYTGAVTVVRNGTPIDVLPLEISGMMSSLPADEVMARLNHMVQALKEMGCELPDPFYRLWSCGFVFRFE
jgi:adenine deaminase